MPAEVCKEDDEYVRDRPRWVAELGNGETIYADDDRPGLNPSSAWQRLRSYCKEQETSIKRLWVQFRSNRVLIEPEDAPGYYCVRNVFGVWGEESQQAYIIGPFDGQHTVNVTRYKLPELVAMETESREIKIDNLGLILQASG